MQRRREGADNLLAFDNVELAKIELPTSRNRGKDIDMVNDPRLNANGQPIDASDGETDGKNQQGYENAEIRIDAMTNS
ncbi:unnamed protein product [Cochlearia groenlandica]